MKIELLQQVLDNERSARREGKGVYIIHDEVELTVLLTGGQDLITVGRVRRINLSEGVLLLETHKGERFYTSADTEVRGLRFSEVETIKGRNTGFGSR